MEDYVRVEPKLFGLPTLEAVEKQLRETYTDYYNKELGKAIVVIDVLSVGEGVIIPGDGAAYYNSKFKLLVWKPELHELVFGEIVEITNFGKFQQIKYSFRKIFKKNFKKWRLMFSKNRRNIP